MNGTRLGIDMICDELKFEQVFCYKKLLCALPHELAANVAVKLLFDAFLTTLVTGMRDMALT